MFDFDLDNFVNEINDVDSSVTSEPKKDETPKTNEIEQDKEDQAIDSLLNQLDDIEINNIEDNAKTISNFVNTLKIQSVEDKEALNYLHLADEAARKALDTNDVEQLKQSEMYLTQGLEKRKEQAIRNEFNNCQKKINNSCNNIEKLKNELANTSDYTDTAQAKRHKLWQNARVAKNNMIIWSNMLSTDIDTYEAEMNDLKKRTADSFGFEYKPADFSNLKKLKLRLPNGITLSEINSILNNALFK